jgi:hypothetical protein
LYIVDTENEVQNRHQCSGYFYCFVWITSKIISGNWDISI